MAILAFILAATLIVSLVLSVFLLWLGALLMRVPKATFKHALLATLILTTLGILSIPASFWVRKEVADDRDTSSLVGAEIMLGLVFLFAGCVVIMRIFNTTLLRAVGIWLINLIAAIVLTPVFYFSLKLFVMEGFIVPTNGMAPTIIGYHREATCPRCQQTLILPAPAPGDPAPWQVDDDRPGICVACRKTSTKPGVEPAVHPPDRVLVNKLLTPERWDVIVFRYPKEPTQRYVKRLVGMPGETVCIKGDSVWINNIKLELPAELAGLEYTTEIELPDLLATEQNPLKLGTNEFCVLGDFSKSSSDSRVWGPLPAANIEGVVCARYWPMGRWHIMR